MGGAALAVMLMIATACTGTKLRENAGMQLYSSVMETVIAPHVERGIAAMLAANQITPVTAEGARAASKALAAALQGEDRMALQPFVSQWNSFLLPLFERGLIERVKAREIGPAGARRFRESAVRFSAGLIALTSR